MSPVRALRLALSLVLPLGLAVALLPADPAPARAADPLAVVTSARYELVPDESRVRVTVDATATSNTPDTATERFYYTGVTLAVQPGATGFAASGEGRPLAVEVVEETDDFVALDVHFSRSVFYQQSYAFTLTFDLADRGGDPYRALVVTRNFISLPVWAYGTAETPGSSVTVIVPGDYDAAVEIGEMRMTPGEDRALILSSTEISRPLEYFSHVVIERRAPLTLEREFSVTLGERSAEIRLRAWEDDAAWARAVEETLTDGLPVLVDAIGLDYPIAGTLTVREAAYRRLGDYAGVYEPLSRTIEMRYDADPFVTLHEAAHIWFNHRLLDERWISEAFASYYAEVAAAGAGIGVEAFELAPELLEHRVPLNAWGEIGRVDLDVEDFAYAATNEVAREIGALAGREGLQAVWDAASDGELAYQPADARRPDVNPSATSQPWQRLLDLLEERTEASYVSIWEEWIVTPDEEELLDERSTAREEYEALETAAAPWELPRSLRLLMDAWQFEDAEAVMSEAATVVEQWEVLEDRARAAGLEPGRDVEVRFEDGSMVGALGEARARLEAIDAIAASGERLAGKPGLLERVGLIGEEPGTTLEAARAAFADSHEDRAIELAGRAAATRADAAERGRGRVALAGGTLLAADALFLGFTLARRNARRRRAATGAASVPPA